MDIATLVRPRSIDEAYEYVTEKGAMLLGGGAWSRTSSRRVEIAVDLAALDLRYIRATGDRIEIGAMATARDIETSELLERSFGPAFREAVSHIVGVQLRNIISVGGTVAGRFGFSDLNTLLLALDAKIALHRTGEVEMQSFLMGRVPMPLLIEKIILGPGRAAFQSVRNTREDLPILNAAAAYTGGRWRLAVGSRPGPSRLAVEAAGLLGTASSPDEAEIRNAAEAASAELSFRTDIRATDAYRRKVCAVLVRRALMETAS